MATTVAYNNTEATSLIEREASLRSVARSLVAPGRILYAMIFVFAGFGHFSAATMAYAAQHGVPLANLLVPVSGIIAILGGLSVMFGYHARIGALLLIAFLAPVTIMMHDFWNVSDPMMAQMQQAMFFKNLSMIGAALLILYFGAGPASMDAKDVHRRLVEKDSPLVP